MAQHEEIVVWLDRRWKEAIEHHLKDETLQEHLENVLDELCNQLPEHEYKRISREIWEEDRMAREEAEAARTYSAYRVVEGGEEHYFRMTPGEELLDAAQTLRKYLKDTDHSTGKFISLYSQAQPIYVRRVSPPCGWYRCKRIGTRICVRNRKSRQYDTVGFSLSKNYPSAPVSAIIEETGVFSWKAGEKMHGMSQSS